MLNSGGAITKVYKSNNKLIVIIPNDVVGALSIKEGDDVDFFEYAENAYILAKKKDIAKLFLKVRESNDSPVEPVKGSMQIGKVQFNRESKAMPQIDEAELQVLKKLDTMRYSDRTAAKIGSILSSSEKETLQLLLKKKIVTPFKKEGEKELKFGIDRLVYDNYLYRKGKMAQPIAAAPVVSSIKAKPSQKFQPAPQPARAWERMSGDSNSYLSMLEAKGYIVLANEAEAAMVSSALEDSIRHGLVLGTRAFNKKFYIGLRGYINKNAAKILKLIDQKSMSISDIANETSVDEDGVRTILYVLSESGDVIEVKKDIFRSA